MRYHQSKKYTSLRDICTKGAQDYKNNVAFLKKDTKGGEYIPVTYMKLFNDVKALSTWLLSLDLPSNKVAVIGDNSYEWWVAYFATTSAGMVIVPIDKDLSLGEMENLLTDSNSSVVFCKKQYADAAKNCNIEKIYTIDFYKSEKEKAPTEISYLINQGNIMLENGNTAFDEVQIDPDTTVSLLYTSGTTGKPKGVMLSHKNITTVINETQKIVKIEQTDRSLSILPCHHTFESTLCLFLLSQGASIAFFEGLRYIMDNFKQAQATILVGVPLIFESIYKKLTKSIKKSGKEKLVKSAIKINKALSLVGQDKSRTLFKDIHEAFGGHLRLIMCGGASLDPGVAEGLTNFGFSLLRGYGLTETAPLIAATPDFDKQRNKKFKSVGAVIPSGKLKIENPDENGIGEIFYKGDNVMQGYYNMPEETAEILEDGWIKTGDLGFIDKKGWLFLTGRSKNVIITKTGKNVYPEELEVLVKNTKIIKECMVYEAETGSEGDTKIAIQLIPDYDYIKETHGTGFDTEKCNALAIDAVHDINKTLPVYKQMQKIFIRTKAFKLTNTMKIKRKDKENLTIQ